MAREPVGNGGSRTLGTYETAVGATVPSFALDDGVAVVTSLQ